MSSDKSLNPQLAAVARFRNVVLSPYVNERFPAWEQLLSAHDVARLIRRPPWMLLPLVVLGRFPRRARFHGRAIGWLRTDVTPWLAKHAPGPRPPASAKTHRSESARQVLLPLEGSAPCAARKVRDNCSLHWSVRR